MHTGTKTDMHERELAHRHASDLDVSLHWRPTDDRLHVRVFDLQTGTLLVIDVADHSPLEVFHHPFAYADAPGGWSDELAA